MTELCGSEPRFLIANQHCLVFLALSLSLSHRETHAEDWPSAAGVHVLELHVAEDESGRSTVQVRRRATRKSYHGGNYFILA